MPFQLCWSCLCILIFIKHIYLLFVMASASTLQQQLSVSKWTAMLSGFCLHVRYVEMMPALAAINRMGNKRISPAPFLHRCFDSNWIPGSGVGGAPHASQWTVRFWSCSGGSSVLVSYPLWYTKLQYQPLKKEHFYKYCSLLQWFSNWGPRTPRAWNCSLGVHGIISN